MKTQLNIPADIWGTAFDHFHGRLVAFMLFAGVKMREAMNVIQALESADRSKPLTVTITQGEE